MKIAFLALLALLFVACGTPKPKVYPQWYKNRELQSAVKYEIIGYGNGNTIKDAEASAKEDIAQTLISKVDSSFTSTSTDDKTTSKAILKVTSNLNLQNVKTIKQEQIDGLFYVALKYKNLDLAYRVKTTIGNFECTKQELNSYLLLTPLVKKLTDSLGCKLNFKLDRRNEAWYLKYKEYLFLLSDDEFEELYETNINDNFEFKSNKTVLTDGDSFYFTFNSKQDGYITLLNVYENGVVTLLQPSAPIKNSIQIPSKDSENYFEAGLVKEDENTYDLYVAIYTKEPLNMSRFEYANEDLASSELAYKFDELIGVMNQAEYSSLLLRTRTK
ncbi:LPP20 family lipoprotein [Candidatus Sulfurimonas baltica]|uniref:LPP20 family lipoprotein n=1 Tax=Candidatus Sulfurimonas baltica TaxID=2740404 RepID=A0A7S7LVN3_9BACT|nr:LPP20 family lipoprotein [Candidatus Sulfurimonas baltica]QOY52298.1 LPP20 family lipoprotein [Candidatus Sulfurimonas baltica]